MAMNLGNLNNFIQNYRAAADRYRTIQQQDAEKQASSIAFQPIDTSLPPVAQTRGPVAPPAVSALAAIPGAGGGQVPPGGALAPPAPSGAPAPSGGPDPRAAAALATLFGGGARDPRAMAPGTPRPAPMPGGMSVMPQASQPQAPPAQPAAAPPAGQSDMGGGVSDPIKEATAWITSTFKGLKAQNPGASPYVLSLAVEKRIEAMKGLAPITKAAMQGQVEVMKNSTRAQQVLLKYEYDMSRARTAEEVAQANRDYKEGMVAAYTGRTAEMETVGMDRNQAMRESATVRAGATRDAAQIRADAAQTVKGMAPGGRRDQAIIDGVAKITAAAAMSGTDPQPQIDAFKKEVGSVAPAGGGAAPQRYQRPGSGPPKDHIAWLKANDTPANRASFATRYGKAALDAALK